MRDFILITCCFTIIWSCKEKPTYNPFDSQFNIDKSELLKDGMDTIIDGCGYYSYGFIKRKFTPLYHYHFDYNNGKLLGKGFYYIVDSIQSFTTNIDSIKNLHYDLKHLNQKLRKFNFRIEKKNGQLTVKNNDNSTTFKATFYTNWENDSIFERGISCTTLTLYK